MFKDLNDMITDQLVIVKTEKSHQNGTVNKSKDLKNIQHARYFNSYFVFCSTQFS
jgi:hypothetical protein